jgi:hypothetical protein
MRSKQSTRLLLAPAYTAIKLKQQQQQLMSPHASTLLLLLLLRVCAAARPLPGYEAWACPLLVPGTQLQTFKDNATLTVAEVGTAAFAALSASSPCCLQS